LLDTRSRFAIWATGMAGLGWNLNVSNPKVAMLLAGLVALIALLIILRLGG
jgi:uncharacterized membrane protein